MFQSGLRSWAGFVAIYMKWVLWVFHALCPRLPNFCDFLGFPHSFCLYPLGQITSSLSNIPGRQSCVCRHCFARAPPVWSVPAFDTQIGGRQRELPVLGERCAQRDEQVSAAWSKNLGAPAATVRLTRFQCTFWETDVPIAPGVHCQR